MKKCSEASLQAITVGQSEIELKFLQQHVSLVCISQTETISCEITAELKE